MVGEKLHSMHEVGNSTFAPHFPHLGNGLVDERGTDGATLHGEQSVGVVAMIAKRELRRVPHPHAGAVSVVPRLRGMKLNFLREFKLGRAAQCLAQDFGLIAQLRVISDVLVMASPAASEVRTCGFNALR